MLFSRNLNSLLPISKCLLKPKIYKCDLKYNNHLKSIKNYYDKTSKHLLDLTIGQDVYFKKTLDSNWLQGKIVNKFKEPRSYKIRDVEGRIYRRNRKYIKEMPINNFDGINNKDINKSDCIIVKDVPGNNKYNFVNLPDVAPNLNQDNVNPIENNSNSTNCNVNSDYLTNNNETLVRKSRLGRCIKRPKKLDDFVLELPE